MNIFAHPNPNGSILKSYQGFILYLKFYFVRFKLFSQIIDKLDVRVYLIYYISWQNNNNRGVKSKRLLFYGIVT